jgi:beta-galactosidase
VGSRNALVFVPISVLDADGALASDAALPLTAEVEGEAEFCGFGSADPQAVGPLASGSCRTFRGRALAILRSTGKSGAIRLKLVAPTLSPVTVVIPVPSP